MPDRRRSALSGGGFSGMGGEVAAVWEVVEHTPFLFVHS